MQTSHSDPAADHRAFAISTYQHCWQLLDADRTPEEDRDLIGLAFTSRHHWQSAGGPTEHAIADWMVSRCLVAIGDATLGCTFAETALGYLEDDSPAWLRASLYEGLARACSATGDREDRDRYLEQARTELATEPDPEDRELIETQINDVP